MTQAETMFTWLHYQIYHNIEHIHIYDLLFHNFHIILVQLGASFDILFCRLLSRSNSDIGVTGW